MNVGLLDQRILVRRWQDVADLGVSIEQTFAADIVLYANKRSASGSVFYGTQQVDNKVTDIFTVRYRQDITAEHVIELLGVRYRVKRAYPYRDRKNFTVIETEALGAIT